MLQDSTNHVQLPYAGCHNTRNVFPTDFSFKVDEHTRLLQKTASHFFLKESHDIVKDMTWTTVIYDSICKLTK